MRFLPCNCESLHTMLKAMENEHVLERRKYVSSSHLFFLKVRHSESWESLLLNQVLGVKFKTHFRIEESCFSINYSEVLGLNCNYDPQDFSWKRNTYTREGWVTFKHYCYKSKKAFILLCMCTITRFCQKAIKGKRERICFLPLTNYNQSPPQSVKYKFECVYFHWIFWGK